MQFQLLKRFKTWTDRAPIQALYQAYQEAQSLKVLEEKFDHGTALHHRSKAVRDFFETRIQRQLLQIRFHLIQFKVSSFLAHNTLTSKFESSADLLKASIFEQLAFIESAIAKYRIEDVEPEAKVIAPTPTTTIASSERSDPNTAQTQAIAQQILPTPVVPLPDRSPSGSLRSTAAQIRRNFNPKYEQEVVQQIRFLRGQQLAATRWTIVLILVPLLVQIVTRNLVFEPLLDRRSSSPPTQVLVNEELEEHFLAKFSQAKELLEISELLGFAPEQSAQERQTELKAIATDLLHESEHQVQSGMKNLLADGTALGVFTILVYVGRKKLWVLRSFFNQIFQNLNDVTKVFILILLTDLFVGYHSVHGWEVLLEAIAKHLGLPENQVLIYGFIATVPVIIDSTLKLWIFNYLTRSSPSSVAIYEKMNQ